MTREEAIKTIEFAKTYISKDGMIRQAIDLALSALRPVSREQVEKMRGEWRLVPNGVGGKQYMCSRCGGAEYEYWRRHFAHGNEKFCSRCGSPMTDEAVEMVMERLNKLEETKK